MFQIKGFEFYLICQQTCILVGGLEHDFFIFPYIGINQLICIEDFGGRYIFGWWFGTFGLFFHILGIIIPTDFHIFQKGLKPPTSINWNIFLGKIQSPGSYFCPLMEAT